MPPQFSNFLPYPPEQYSEIICLRIIFKVSSLSLFESLDSPSQPDCFDLRSKNHLSERCKAVFVELVSVNEEGYSFNERWNGSSHEKGNVLNNSWRG